MEEAAASGEEGTEPILVRQDGPVRTITLNRPDRRNALDSVAATKLYEACLAFEEDEASSVAILTGAGGHFCAGADLKALNEGDPQKDLPPGGVGTRGPMGPTRLRLSKPVIAAVEGFAVAGGLELALWADLRVMADTATFGVFCRRFGVPLVDLGTLRLPRLIGEARAMDLILTGRAVQAEEALMIGLANRMTSHGEALETATALAHQLAGFPQTCLRHDRLSMLEAADLTEEEAILNERAHGLRSIGSGETLAGAARFAGGTGRHGRFE